MGVLALIVGAALVIWLARQDAKSRTASSMALLIPGLWIFIQTTHPLSFWFGLSSGGENVIDTLVTLGLMVAAVIVVQRRRLDWGAVAQQNLALLAIYGYFALSAVWSEAPLLSFRRIIKDFGLVPVALVLLTSPNPTEAIRTVFVRVSYLVFTFSVITIKWFPAIGRQPRHSGDSMFRGITLHKNTLGLAVCILGLMLLWDLMEIRRSQAPAQERKRQIAIRIGMLLMGMWLLVTCQSKTALLCIVIGISVAWVTKRLVGMRNGKRFLVSGLAGVLLLFAADKTLGITEFVIRALGKDPSMTGRTEIWHLVKEEATDPWLGDGFYVFWDTAKGERVVEQLALIKSVHNGYLEVYVDGGLVGVGLLGLFLLSVGRRSVNRAFEGNPLGVQGLAFFTIAVIYNLSESSFFRLDPLWFMLLLTTMGGSWVNRHSVVEGSNAALRWFDSGGQSVLK